MSTHAVKKIDDLEAVYGGAFKRARAELGVESFGMQIIDMPANYEGYPEHDHSEDGQEEVYLALRGAGEIEIEGERFPLDEDHIARVGPGVKRKVWPGETGVRILSSAARPATSMRHPRSPGSASPTRWQARSKTPSATAPVTLLVAGADGDRHPRVARIGRVLPRAKAQREDRATGIADQLLMAAAVAEAGSPAGLDAGHSQTLSARRLAPSSSRLVTSTCTPVPITSHR